MRTIRAAIEMATVEATTEARTRGGIAADSATARPQEPCPRCRTRVLRLLEQLPPSCAEGGGDDHHRALTATDDAIWVPLPAPGLQSTVVPKVRAILADQTLTMRRDRREPTLEHLLLARPVPCVPPETGGARARHQNKPLQ